MARPIFNYVARALIIIQVVVIYCTLGCGDSDGANSREMIERQTAIGKVKYAKADCSTCHTIDGHGGHRGPELTLVDHTQDWFFNQIETPSVHKPKARMPAHKGKLSDDDVSDIARYLESLNRAKWLQEQ